MDGVRTSERSCRMKIWTNIPSVIMVRGTKLRVDYPGQPKTCSRCMKFWSSCPGGGKVEKCKKEGGEEKDLKAYFKNLVNRLKKKSKTTESSDPIVPTFIPNPDVVRFTGFPENFSLDNFKSWLDEREVNFLEAMLFKENKPGVFSVATVEVDGEVLRLDAGEAAGLISALNGVEFKGRRIMVTMLTMNTPEKVKKQEVVTLDSSPETPAAPVAGQLALPAPGEGTGDNPDTSIEELTTPEKSVSQALKIKIAAAQTAGGTKHHRVVGEKVKRLDDSSSSLEASPELNDKKRNEKPGPWANRQKELKAQKEKDKKKNTQEGKPSKKKSKSSPSK